MCAPSRKMAKSPIPACWQGSELTWPERLPSVTQLCRVQAPSQTPEQVLRQLSTQDSPQPPSPTALQVPACSQLFDGA